MKKIIFFSIGAIAILLIAVICLPFLFQEKIKSLLVQEALKGIKAEVSYSDVSVSSFKNFPHIAINFHDFNMVGKESFKNDTLASAKILTISFDIYTVLEGKHIDIKSIHLEEPLIHIKILADGSANYNIITEDSIKKEASPFEIDVERWEIVNGSIIYENRLQDTYIEMGGLNHFGKGDFKQNISDLNITTSVSEMSFYCKGVKYLVKKKFTADLVIEMDMKQLKFTFRNHSFEVNHFKFAFDGYFRFLPKGYEVDLRFIVKETNFRNLLSILPGIYINDLKRIKTSGEFAVNGYIKGIYNYVNGRIPGFHLNLSVENGMVKYEHLPKAIENINMNMVIENKDGDPAHTSFDVKHFHLDMDKNPVHGYFKMTGLTKGYLDTDIKADLNLAEIGHICPVNGLVMKGILKADIRVKGNFDDKLKKFPVVDARLKLDSGYVKDSQFPVALENIHFNAEILNPTGQLADTRMRLHKMTYLLDGEPFDMKGSVNNFIDYNFDLKIDGKMDFDKLSKVYPLHDATITGIMDVNIETAGKMSDLEASNFNAIKNSGTIKIRNLTYKSENFSKILKLSEGNIYFTPERVVLEKFQGVFGKSAISVSGHLFDYLTSIVNPKKDLKGDLTLICDTLDLNEWMPPASGEDTLKQNKRPLLVPANLDFTFDSRIKYIRFENIVVKALSGEARIKDRQVTLNETGFNAADAAFTLNGNYNTSDTIHPRFDMAIEVKKLDLGKAFGMFSKEAGGEPSAQTTDGVFSTMYTLNGEMGPDFKPLFQTLTGKGTIYITQAQIKGMKILKHVSAITKKKEISDSLLKDIVMETEIRGGKIFVKPFAFKIGKFDTEVAGNYGFNNALNYVLKLSVPPFNKIKIPFHITGTPDKPIVKIGKGHENYDFSKL